MPDGRHIVFSPGDETVVLLHVAEKRVVTTCRGHDGPVRAVAVSADARSILSGAADRTVRLFDAITGELKITFQGHADQVDCVGITTDGRIGVSGAQDGTLRSWNLETRAPLTVLDGHASFVRSLVVTRDDLRIISGSSDKTIRHWNLERRTAAVRNTTRAGPVTVLSLSANGMRAVSGSRTSDLSVWDVAHGTVTGTLAGHAANARLSSPVTRMSGLVTAVSLTEDGSTAVSASRDSTLRIWDVMSGRTLHTLTGHSDAVLKIAVSANGRHAASLARDRTVRVWDLANGSAVRVLAADDNMKAVTSQTSDPLLLELGQHVTLDITQSPISRDAEVTISPDGRHVLIGDDSGVLCWDVLTGRSLKERFDDFMVVAMATGLPGRAILGSRTGWIKVWDLGTCTTTHTFKAHDRQVLDLAINTDLHRLVSAGRDNTISVWDLAGMGLVSTLHGASSELDEVAVAPDARVAYSIYGDKIVASDLMQLSHLGSVSLDHQITVVAVASDGTSVAAGDESGMVHFLSLER
jgi:WD40 repeat protein